MQITIIGGSGFLGTRLTKRLLESGHTVKIADKRKSVFGNLFILIDYIVVLVYYIKHYGKENCCFDSKNKKNINDCWRTDKTSSFKKKTFCRTCI